jgi:hypothetical protein
VCIKVEKFFKETDALERKQLENKKDAKNTKRAGQIRLNFNNTL